jgi:hypothetical protein
VVWQQQPLGGIRVPGTFQSLCLKQGCECRSLSVEKVLRLLIGIDALAEGGDLTSESRLTAD